MRDVKEELLVKDSDNRKQVNVEEYSNTKEAIVCAATALFFERGLTKTSLSDIAVAAGVSKSLVQKHIKKKDSLVKIILRRILDYSDCFLRNEKLITDDYWKNLYLVGVLNYSFLLSNTGRRRFLLDVVESRALTSLITQMDFEWAFAYMGEFGEKDRELLLEDMSFAMGATYDLLYRNLIVGKEIHPFLFQKRSLSLTMLLRGMSQETIDSLLDGIEMSSVLIDRGVRFIEAGLGSAK